MVKNPECLNSNQEDEETKSLPVWSKPEPIYGYPPGHFVGSTHFTSLSKFNLFNYMYKSWKELDCFCVNGVKVGHSSKVCTYSTQFIKWF